MYSGGRGGGGGGGGIIYLTQPENPGNDSINSPRIFINSYTVTLTPFTVNQGLSQDLETWYQNLAIVKCLGVLFFKVDHNILRLQP